MAIQHDGDPGMIKESWSLSLAYDRPTVETMYEQIFQRSTARWWTVDTYEFVDLRKLEPAMIYQRHIRTTTASDAFFRGYFDSAYSLEPDFDPYARNPRGFDPALRGSEEARSRELALYRRADRASEDDPWYDVATAYEHYAARTLLRVADGYVDAVWLLSEGADGDPGRTLEIALEREEQRAGGEILGVIGPYPANTSATLEGNQVMRAFKRFDGGVEEFEAKVLDLSAWS